MNDMVDGIIEDWSEVRIKGGTYVQGRIYSCSRGRKDGYSMHTSFIREIRKEDGLILTQSSVYKLGKSANA